MEEGNGKEQERTEPKSEGTEKSMEKLRAMQESRKQQPSKADMAEAVKHNEKIAFEKNLVMLAQLERHEKKLLGNSKLNEDEYRRKKGRMKIINPTYEWETDEAQQSIDEAKLKSVYEDSKEALALEVEKVEKTRLQVQAQQDKLLVKYEDFKALELNKEEIIRKAEEKTKNFKP